MMDQVAGPGQPTCTGDDCRAAGMHHPGGHAVCIVCGGPLGRIPGGAADSPTNSETVSQSVRGWWQEKPVGTQIAIAAIVAVALLIVQFIVRNPDFLHRLTGNEYQAGDCLRAETRL